MQLLGFLLITIEVESQDSVAALRPGMLCVGLPGGMSTAQPFQTDRVTTGGTSDLKKWRHADLILMLIFTSNRIFAQIISTRVSRYATRR
jgi:hypothetical protein